MDRNWIRFINNDIYRPCNSALPLGILWVSALAVLAYLELRGSVSRRGLLLVTGPTGLVALLHLSHQLSPGDDARASDASRFVNAKSYSK